MVFLTEDVELSIHICKMGAKKPPLWGYASQDCVKCLLKGFREPC